MLKIAGIALIIVMVSIILMRTSKEYAILCMMGGCILLFFMGLTRLKVLTSQLSEMEQTLGIPSQYTTVFLKMLGISYIAEFTSSLCKDAGQGAIALQVDFAGKVAMVVLSFPVLQALVQTIRAVFV